MKLLIELLLCLVIRKDTLAGATKKIPGHGYRIIKKTDFSVKIVRHELEKSLANTSQNNIFNWNRIAVPKINHFVWRAMEGWIPTATALARRSVNVGNERCPLCGIAEEDADHLLVACSFARSVW
ncbi:putative reverse transcriptase zinc-binding domain-containing protein [Helianthus anomalus]